MRWYQDLIQSILENGEECENRTGINTLSIPHFSHTFDLSKSFPAITLKRLPIKSVIGELLGFLRGADNAKTFRELDCQVWDANANLNGVNKNPWLQNSFRKGEDDLGRIYGVQWRNWRDTLSIPVSDKAGEGITFHGYQYDGTFYKDGESHEVWAREVDQLKNLISSLKYEPTSRRMIINSWNVSDLNKMALVPCHVLQHYLCTKNESSATGYQINLTMYQRSCDVVLGLPFNIASYAALVAILCRITGHAPGKFTYITGDTHIYSNHLPACEEILSRTPRDCAPKLRISPHLETLQDFEKATPNDFYLLNYEHCGGLSSPTPMAV